MPRCQSKQRAEFGKNGKHSRILQSEEAGRTPFPGSKTPDVGDGKRKLVINKERRLPRPASNSIQNRVSERRGVGRRGRGLSPRGLLVTDLPALLDERRKGYSKNETLTKRGDPPAKRCSLMEC